MSSRTDEALRLAMATIVEVAPDSPELPAVQRVSSEFWRRPARVLAGASALVLVVGAIGAIRWSSSDGEGAADLPAATSSGQVSTDTPTVSAPSSVSPGELEREEDEAYEARSRRRLLAFQTGAPPVVLGSGQEPTEWSISALVDTDGWVCSRVSISAPPFEQIGQGPVTEVCQPTERWAVPEVLSYSVRFTGLRGDSAEEHPLGDVLFGITSETVAIVSVDFAGGATANVATFGEESGLLIRGYFYGFLTGDFGEPVLVSAYDDEGTLLGTFYTSD